MSALKDLQELIAGDYEFAEAWEYWGKEHGQAVAELITEASRTPIYNGKGYDVTGFGIDIQFRTLSEADAFIRERIRAVIRKLNQDA